MNGRLAAAALLTCAGAPGCALDADLVEVPTRGARAALVVEPAVPRGEAIDLLSSDDLRYPAVDGPLFALGYGCPLDALGIAPGPLTFGGERALPAAAFVRRREGAGWIDAPASALEALRLVGPRVSDCLTLEVDTRAVTGTEQEGVGAAASLGGERALLTTRLGRFFEIGEATIAPVALATTTPQAALFREDDGRLFAVGATGRTARGGPAGFVEGPRMVSGALLGDVWVDGAGAGGALELFVLTETGALERFDGASFTRLADDLGAVADGGVAWLAPGRALVTGLGAGRYLRVDGAEVRSGAAGLGEGDDFAYLRHLRGVGVFAGTKQGYLYRYDEGAWTLVAPQPLSPGMSAVIALDGRLFFGGNGGTLWQLVLATGELCAPRSYASVGARVSVAFDGGFLLMGHDRGAPIEVARARRSPSSACGARP